MRSASFVVLLLLSASLAGCSGDDDSIPDTDPKDEEILNLNERLNESAVMIESLEERLAELQEQADQVPSLQATIAGLNTEVTLLNDNISGLEEGLQGLEINALRCEMLVCLLVDS